jgi:hypothetical protein
MSVKLNVKKFNELQQEKGWSDLKTAEEMEISPIQIWRARLPDDDPRHNDPGKEFISGALLAFEVKFEDIFFLSESLRSRNEEKRKKGA